MLINTYISCFVMKRTCICASEVIPSIALHCIYEQCVFILEHASKM